MTTQIRNRGHEVVLLLQAKPGDGSLCERGAVAACRDGEQPSVRWTPVDAFGSDGLLIFPKGPLDGLLPMTGGRWQRGV
jgi:hypothetical protein